MQLAHWAKLLTIQLSRYPAIKLPYKADRITPAFSPVIELTVSLVVCDEIDNIPYLSGNIVVRYYTPDTTAQHGITTTKRIKLGDIENTSYYAI